MPDFTFTSPEGKSYTVTGPEGATKEQAFQVLQQQIASGTAKEEPQGRTAKGYGEFAAGNILKGAAEQLGPIAEAGQKVVDAPGMVINYLMDKFSGGKSATHPLAPTTAQAAKLDQGAVGEVLKKVAPNLLDAATPKTSSEKYAAAALQALPTAVGGEGSLARRALQAAGAGVGAKVGGDVGGVPGAIAGSIVGGGIGGALSAEKQSPKALSKAAEQSKTTGIPLTIGQETGSKSLTAAENIIGKTVLGQGTAYTDKVKQATAGVAAVSKLADRLSKEPQNAEDIGRKLQTSLTGTVKHYDDLRSTDAARDYGAVRALAQDRPVIQYTETVNALNRIIDETRNVPSGESKKIYQQAIAMRDDLVLGNKARTFKIDDAMRTRRAWGAAARGTGNVFTDVDPNLSRQFAGRLFGAINNDFEAASQSNTPIAQALAKANKRYADYSKSIDYVRKSALGSLVGEDVVDAAFTGAHGTVKAPEMMANRYMNLQPSQARQVTNILRRNNPQVLADTKAYVLRDMLEKASNTAPGQPPMSFDRFLTQYKKMEPKLKEMGFTQEELKDIRDVTDTMARAADKTGANPSGTAQALQFAALAMHPAFIVPNYVAAKALLTPQGRVLLRRAYAGGSRSVKYQAGRALMAAYGEERNRQQEQGQAQGQGGQ